jgi:hypothetical protein
MGNAYPPVGSGANLAIPRRRSAFGLLIGCSGKPAGGCPHTSERYIVNPRTFTEVVYKRAPGPQAEIMCRSLPAAVVSRGSGLLHLS